ncbi:MAG: PilZ domain-containing protein [Candidatus Omnitrophica bacterium]|nr:PilZ domain-containing protein [Candidatus Omnitrophota bacterium]
MMVEDRRRYKRFNADAKASYIVTDPAGTVVEKGTGTLENVSYIGAKINLERSLCGKVRFLIEFILGNAKTSIIAIGKMVWIKDYGHDSCGIVFDWISDEKAYQKYLTLLEEAEGVY